MLDLPGLWADDTRERKQVGQIVSHYAMTMDLIVFVHRADAMAGDFNDEVITTNTVLSAWRENPDGYRVVLTRPYSEHSLRTEMLDALGPRGLKGPRVLAFARARLAHQLAASMDDGDPDTLADRIYPVELGRTMDQNFRDDPRLARAVREATELAIDNLRDDIARSAGVDASYYRHVSQVATRVTNHVRQRRRARQVRLAEAHHELEQAQEAVTTSAGQLEACQREQEQAARRLQAVKAGYQALTTTAPHYDRPGPPTMKAVIVRTHQEQERAAWMAAAIATWDSWSKLAADGHEDAAPLPIAATALRQKYDECVGCCGECTDNGRQGLFKKVGRPQVCYGRMTAVAEPMSSWLLEAFRLAASPTVARCEGVLADAGERVRAATRLAKRAQVRLAAAVDDLETTQADADEQAAGDDHDEGLAHDVFDVLRRENQRYVERLAQQLVEADPADRGWFAMASLLARKELEGMVDT